MIPGRKEDDKIPKGAATLFTFILLFLNISNLHVPVAGFCLKTCRISNNKAICSKMLLRAVPQGIPSTVTNYDLAVNKISRIKASDFRNLSVLTQLDINRNFISKIERGAFADLTSLKKFNLNNNRLPQLEDDIFHGLSNLTELRLASNKIKSVASTSFKSLTSLLILDLSYNKFQVKMIRSVFHCAPHLRYLALKKIGLTAFHSWELTNTSIGLTYLDLSQNPIQVFQVTDDVFPSLRWLNIGGAPQRQKMTWELRNKTLLSHVTTLDIGGLHLASDDIETFFESFNFSLTSLRMRSMKCNLAALINASCTIPTLSELQLRLNKLTVISSDLLQVCGGVTELDLAVNNIETFDNNPFEPLKGLKVLSLSRNRLQSVPVAVRNISTLMELDLSSNNITSLSCHDFANLTKLKVLSLYQNFIVALSRCVFEDLSGLQVLKLQLNRITKLGGAFGNYLPKLKQLLLDRNKLTTIKQHEFKGLQALQNLSLRENQIDVLEKGCFVGLTELTDIQLQSNDIKSSEVNKGVFNEVINLRRLDLRDNHIKYWNNTALFQPPFFKLSQLESLSIPGQHSRGKGQLPRNFLQGLTSLKVFESRNIQLLSLHKDMFNYTPQLQTLDISSNDLTDLSPDLLAPLHNLKSLYISRTTLGSLDFLIKANLTNLEFLQARRNSFFVIREDEINSLPALVYVDLQSNSFTCDCNNAWFIRWMVNSSQTQVFDAYNFVCNYPPDLKGMKLLDLDIRSCSVDTGFICYIATTCVNLLFILVCLTYHFLRWQMVYAYYLLLAFLFERKQKNRQAQYQYDAFVSYNVHDEPWVMEELLPKLEGEQGWRLCLHHRDFQPGKSIIDNITDAIYGSRKTICMISRRYLESEWCSREIQVASFRLFDEQKDVLILVFLEDIPIAQLSPYYRMRKLLKKQTFLSWPRAGENTQLFWEQLRKALQTRDEPAGERFLLTVVDAQR
ncbi:toll-like receptor 22 [Aulostomus maculatus]